MSPRERGPFSACLLDYVFQLCPPTHPQQLEKSHWLRRGLPQTSCLPQGKAKLPAPAGRTQP